MLSIIVKKTGTSYGGWEEVYDNGDISIVDEHNIDNTIITLNGIRNVLGLDITYNPSFELYLVKIDLDYIMDKKQREDLFGSNNY